MRIFYISRLMTAKDLLQACRDFRQQKRKGEVTCSTPTTANYPANANPAETSGCIAKTLGAMSAGEKHRYQNVRWENEDSHY